ncbi:MAG: membrane protein insertase YidC [Oscillospiraceae bacterium]|nr:membrane protein insertase YidC [Oscillospiraceae bacterium]
MNIIDLVFGSFFGFLMRLCYDITNNFGWSIVIFSVLIKLVLFPISLISQKNSIIMVKIKPMLNDLQARYASEPDVLLQEQKALFKKEKYSAIKALLPLLVQIPIIIGVISVVNNPVRHLGENVNADFFGVDMFAMPENLFIPALAIISTILLCVIQNTFNVISKEQGFFGKWGVMLLLTVFTGWFVFVVPTGVGLYWTYSNLTGILVLAVCNIIYNPKKYIDYEHRTIKPKLTKVEKEEKRRIRKIEKEREKADMQRFFSVEKEVVFFSESKGFIKYFERFIDYIINNSDITVHYLTADINDPVLELNKSQFEAYYCSDKGLITTFMKMDAAIVVMTLADLNVYHYKRSIVRKDIEYIYIDHGLGSCNLLLRKGALNHYDTIFCNCKEYNEEIRATESVYNLKEKNLVNVGFGLLDTLIEKYEKEKSDKLETDKPYVLIAPSWQRDNIIEICLSPILDAISKLDVKIVLRPHPEFVKRFVGKMQSLYSQYSDLIKTGVLDIQTDFSSNSTVYNADLVITDWSSIAVEYSLTTKKPTLFINTPMKIMNPEWQKIDVEPMDFTIRNIIGISLDIDKLDDVASITQKLLDSKDTYKAAIEDYMSEHLYNVGTTASVGGGYIIDRVLSLRP